MYDARFRANAQEFIRNLRDYGILRYRNPNEPQAKPDPRGGFQEAAAEERAQFRVKPLYTLANRGKRAK